MYKLPERGGGAMPERKHSFLKEVFPKRKLFKNTKETEKGRRKKTGKKRSG